MVMTQAPVAYHVYSEYRPLWGVYKQNESLVGKTDSEIQSIILLILHIFHYF